MASLMPAIVRVWNTKHPGKRMGVAIINYYFLNTNRIIELRDLGSNYSGFYFANDPDDARDSPDYLEVAVTTTNIELYHNATPASKFGTIPIFPSWDITETPVNTEIPWENIAYAWQTPRDFADNVMHMVYYRKPWQRVECLVDWDFTELTTEFSILFP